MQGADQHIRSSSGFSILPKGASICSPGESNPRPSNNKMWAVPLGHNCTLNYCYCTQSSHTLCTSGLFSSTSVFHFIAQHYIVDGIFFKHCLQRFVFVFLSRLYLTFYFDCICIECTRCYNNLIYLWGLIKLSIHPSNHPSIQETVGKLDSADYGVKNNRKPSYKPTSFSVKPSRLELKKKRYNKVSEEASLTDE